MAVQLGNQHRSALLALMGLGGEVSNPDLRDAAGFTITGEVRTRLNTAGYVDSHIVGRSFVHKVTPKGWDRCVAELSADRPARPGPFGAALYLVLGGLDQYLKQKNLRLTDLFQHNGLESRIRKAYHKLAAKPRDWVRLADLRPLLNGATNAEVDVVLKEMSRARRAHIVPISNSKVLTDADHAAAVRIGGQDNHQIVVEES